MYLWQSSKIDLRAWWWHSWITSYCEATVLHIPNAPIHLKGIKVKAVSPSTHTQKLMWLQAPHLNHDVCSAWFLSLHFIDSLVSFKMWASKGAGNVFCAKALTLLLLSHLGIKSNERTNNRQRFNHGHFYFYYYKLCFPNRWARSLPVLHSFGNQQQTQTSTHMILSSYCQWSVRRDWIQTERLSPSCDSCGTRSNRCRLPSVWGNVRACPMRGGGSE